MSADDLKASGPGSGSAAGAVFLSYASEDALAAERICAALRAVGIEVWLDQSELRGGDAWDEAIRNQIKTCALFMPLLSHTTHDRPEGYFRLEWKLAVDRSYLIMAGKPFLVPVAIDEAEQRHVPERFREVQWTRLPAGRATPEFVAHIRHLLSPQAISDGDRTPARGTAAHGAATVAPAVAAVAARVETKRAALPWAMAALFVLVVGYFIADKFWLSRHPLAASGSTDASSPLTPAPPTGPRADTFSPPAHSIAVLPFVNLSGDQKQEYFSDGLTEELLNSLAEIQGLQVAARTSAFSFKGQETDIGTIARKLNVATVLEGSVRRSEHTVRITAQLIDAKSGFHVWSKTFDRDLGDVLKLQSEIATAVAKTLQVTLLGDVGSKIEVGGTRNPAALDAYLRGKQQLIRRSEASTRAAVEDFSEAIRLDPKFALAYAYLSMQLSVVAAEYASGGQIKSSLDRASQGADESARLAPELGVAHLALGNVAQGRIDFRRAAQEYDRALALSPGDALVARVAGGFQVFMGRADTGLAMIRRAVTLDPLNERAQSTLGTALMSARRYDEAIATLRPHVARFPEDGDAAGALGFAHLRKGDAQSAREVCETLTDYWSTQTCLVMALDRLGHRDDSDKVFAKLREANGDDAAYQYAMIYAQRGDTPRALDALDTAFRGPDPGLVGLKVDPFLDPLRKDPHFQALLKKLDFPE